MNVEDLKRKTEADISEFITKKIIELKKKTGKEPLWHDSLSVFFISWTVYPCVSFKKIRDHINLIVIRLSSSEKALSWKVMLFYFCHKI